MPHRTPALFAAIALCHTPAALAADSFIGMGQYANGVIRSTAEGMAVTGGSAVTVVGAGRFADLSIGFDHQDRHPCNSASLTS